MTVHLHFATGSYGITLHETGQPIPTLDETQLSQLTQVICVLPGFDGLTITNLNYLNSP